MGTQQFCLKWNNHQTNMLAVFDQLLSSEALVDVTLACEGLSLKAHKMVLSACSPFFQSLFLENPCKHPIVILKDMKYTDLKAIVDFMYRGEVNVSQDQLSALLKTAETLKVKGLAEVTGEQQRGASGVIQQEVIQQALSTPIPASGAQQQHRAESPPLSRRKRGRPRRRSLSDSNRSDTEEVPSKIKEPDSPEVVEELSRDGPNDTSEVRQRLSSNHPQTQVAISHSNVLPSVTQKSITLPSVQDSVTVEEPQSGEDTEFEMEPSKLMEQTMTTDNVSVFSDSPSQGPTLTPVSNQLPIPTTMSLVDTPHHTPGPCGDSQALVPCSMPSEASTSSHLSQDTTQDIKPGALVSFEEPPISPVAGPSHQDSSSSMMMYMDTSGVPAIPGPSNYQLDKQQNQPQQQPQPQGISYSNMDPEVLEMLHNAAKRGRKPGSRLCTVCKKVFTSTSELLGHMTYDPINMTTKCLQSPETSDVKQETSSSGGLILAAPRDCAVCKIRLNTIGDLQNHLTANPGCRTRQFDCHLCPRSFIWPITMQKHFKEQHESAEGAPPRVPQRLWFFCDICDKALLSKHALTLHRQKFHPLQSQSDSMSDDFSDSLYRKRGRKPGTRVCKECKKTFSSTTDFMRHRQRYHSRSPNSLEGFHSQSENSQEERSSTSN